MHVVSYSISIDNFKSLDQHKEKDVPKKEDAKEFEEQRRATIRAAVETKSEVSGKFLGASGKVGYWSVVDCLSMFIKIYTVCCRSIHCNFVFDDSMTRMWQLSLKWVSPPSKL